MTRAASGACRSRWSARRVLSVRSWMGKPAGWARIWLGEKLRSNLAKWGRGKMLQLLWESSGESWDSAAGGKWCVQTSLAFMECWSISQWFCKLGWLSQSLRGHEVLIQQSRWAVTAPARAGRERSTGESRRGGNRLMQWAPRECKAIAKPSWGRGVSPSRYKPLLSISCNWFFWGYFIASPPTPSKVSLFFTTDTVFLWGYQSSPKQERS